MTTQPTTSFRGEYAALGATAETVVRQPLMATASVMISTQKGFFDAVKHLYQKGGVSPFYSGVQGASVALVTRAMHRVTTFGASQRLKEHGLGLPAIAVTAASLETSLTMFSEMFLTAAQTQAGNQSPMQILMERFKKAGMKTLGTGFQATMGRNISFNALYFAPSYYYPQYVKDYPLTTAFASATGAVYGSHVFEVLRVQKVTYTNQSYLLITKDLLTKMGPRWIILGITPRYMSVGVGSFIAMAVYNKAIKR